MEGNDLNIGIIPEKFPNLTQIDIHASCVEIAIVTPDLFEGERTTNTAIQLGSQQSQQNQFQYEYRVGNGL